MVDCGACDRRINRWNQSLENKMAESTQEYADRIKTNIHMDGRRMQQHRIEHILQDGFREFILKESAAAIDALELTEREKVMLLIIRRTIQDVQDERKNLVEFSPIYLDVK
jgi:hypothetical protein